MGLFTTKKAPGCRLILTTSSASNLCETCPSRVIIVPLLMRIGCISTVLSALITIGRKLRECGQTGVITIAEIFADRIGPPADRL